MTDQEIRYIQPFIHQLMDAPLPAIPGCGSEFYLDIESIRCQAVTQICANLIKRRSVQSTDTELQALRELLEPIRLDLLRRYPERADQLDPAAWPDSRQQS